MAGRAVFLDRDGVLNVESGYITRPEDLQMLPGAADAVARLTRNGWRVFVFTNQSGVGRGLMTIEALGAVNDRLYAEVIVAGGALAGIYACPHPPDAGCDCRKPRPGLLQRAAREHDLDLTACWVVGDSPRDIAAGRSAGCKTLLVLTGHTTEYDPAAFSAAPPDHIFPNLPAAVDWLCLSDQPSAPGPAASPKGSRP